MKKIIFILTFILSLSASVFASNVNVQINGEIVNFKDEQGNVVNAQIINDRTMVPMRKIFEILGAEIEWDGENRKVTGTKGDVVIELQIDNPIATKKVNGELQQITLDAPPTIVNDRTMVPLRFIAESLDKQVGWDGQNRTAIIIDYSYFSNKIKTDAPALYNFLNIKKESIECNITHKYYDLTNESNNTTFNAKTNVKVTGNKQDVALTISGTDELSREIVSEGWNNIGFSFVYNDDSVMVNTENKILQKMFNVSGINLIKTYDELAINGSATASQEEMFEIWAGIKDNELNVNTFSKLRGDFNSLCNLFKTTNTSANQLSSISSPIKYSSYKIEYFDLAKLDNFICENNHIRVLNMINQMFFKYDIQKDVMLYDTNNISINFNVNMDMSKINIETTNDYNEKDEYIIELKHV